MIELEDEKKLRTLYEKRSEFVDLVCEVDVRDGRIVFLVNEGAEGRWKPRLGLDEGGLVNVGVL